MDQWIIGLVQNEHLGQWGIFFFTIITTLIAALLSGIIGLEREMKGQAAGLRTHVILAVACSLLMTISIYAIHPNLVGTLEKRYYDAARIAAGILGGIGFMGAGAIVKNGLSIKGLTTAATLFYASAVGLGCGSGFVAETIGVTLLVFFLLLGLVFIEKLLDNRSPAVELIVDVSIPIIHELRTEAEKYRLVIKNIVSEAKKSEEGVSYTDVVVFFAYHSDLTTISDFCENFSAYPFVKSVKMMRHMNGKKHRGSMTERD